ncbi:MAG: hypothetical protein ACE5HE_10905 [Phycisphaerae bacterium]
MNDMTELASSAPIVVTSVIGAMLFAIKRIPKVPGWLLPFLAYTMGIVAFCSLVGWTAIDAMNGLIVGAAATGFHQGGSQVGDRLKKKKK